MSCSNPDDQPPTEPQPPDKRNQLGRTIIRVGQTVHTAGPILAQLVPDTGIPMEPLIWALGLGLVQLGSYIMKRYP